MIRGHVVEVEMRSDKRKDVTLMNERQMCDYDEYFHSQQ